MRRKISHVAVETGLIEGALHKYNIIPQLFPKKSWNFYTITSVDMSNDYMLSSTLYM